MEFDKISSQVAQIKVVGVGGGGNNAVKSFREKSRSDGALINAGYMVLNPEIFNYIEGDKTVFEKTPLEKLASEGELMSYVHKGFWQCMDNIREKTMLEKLLSLGKAPWKRWDREVPDDRTKI